MVLPVERVLAAGGAGEAAFYPAKLATGECYFRRLLPRTASHPAGTTLPAWNFTL